MKTRVGGSLAEGALSVEVWRKGILTGQPQRAGMSLINSSLVTLFLESAERPLKCKACRRLSKHGLAQINTQQPSYFNAYLQIYWSRITYHLNVIFLLADGGNGVELYPPGAANCFV